MTHEDYQGLIPAWVAGRSDDEEGRAIEAHLRDCEDCAAVAETWRSVRGAFEEDPASLTDTHPAPAELREFATAPASHAGLRPHVESCLQCSLVVSGWQGRSTAVVEEKAPTEVHRGNRSWLLLAAGVLLGAMGFWLVGSSGRLEPSSGGEAKLLVLREAHRGTASSPRYVPQPHQSLVPIVLDIGAPAPGTRAELQDESGETVWSSSLAAESPRVLLIPMRLLPEGKYRVTLVLDGSSQEVLPFEIGD